MYVKYLPFVVSMTFLPSATALLAASLASPAATDTLENSLSKASMAEFLAWLAGRAIVVYTLIDNM